MDHKLITTGLTIEGYKITQNLGIVRGIIVRSRSIFGNIGAAFQTIVGGNITLYTELCEKTREDSFEVMIKDRYGAEVWLHRYGNGPSAS